MSPSKAPNKRRFGDEVRSRREALKITLRKFAALVEMSPTYLSKVERGEFPPPSEQKIVAIAKNLQMDSDELLALAGRVASDVTDIIQGHTEMAAFLRSMNRRPKEEVGRLLRKIQADRKE